MDDLLSPASTVKKIQNNIDKFETLTLNDSSKARSNNTKSKRSILEITSSSSSDAVSEHLDLKASLSSSNTSISPQPLQKRHKRHDSTAFLQKSYLTTSAPASLPGDAREILNSQPDHEDLVAVLQYLQYGIDGKHDFNIHVSGAQQSQLINTLVSVTVPDQWHVLRQPILSKSDLQLKHLLIVCLKSIAGVAALLLQIGTTAQTKSQANSLMLEDMASLLGSILEGPNTLIDFLAEAHRLYIKESQRRLSWQEVVSLFAGSKVLSTLARSLGTVNDVSVEEAQWLADGTKYCTWLSRNITVAMTKLPSTDTESWVMLSHVVKRALSLGYRDALVSELYSSLLLGTRALWTPLQQLLQNLASYEQKSFFDTMLRDLVRKYLRAGQFYDLKHTNGLEGEAAIGGVAAMIAGIVQSNPILEDHVIQWLTNTSGEYAGLGLDTRRAVIATLALREEKLHFILEKCLASFSDKVQTQHNSILQQESMAQIILLAIGYLNRLNHETIKEVSKSSAFLQTVSNRLAASMPRARFLGMFVGVAVSRLVDDPDKVMRFDVEEAENEEAQRWLNLVNVNDKVGDIDQLRQKAYSYTRNSTAVPHSKPAASSRSKKAARPQMSKIIAIEEIEGEDDDEEDDLIPYQKPDADPSDSEDDPTLINRSKPSAPVYIIDLIRQLQTNDKPDVIDLALTTAPALIRRKAGFGTEVSDNIQALASALINIQDVSEHEMEQLRLDSLIACLVAKPEVLGPWAASMYFEGDFSLVQRASILTTVGLGCREMAGYKDDPKDDAKSSSFASQRLPSHLAAIYSQLDSVARQIEHSTLQPMALAAADKVTGPDVLKVRTFSSRMEVEKKTTQKAKERSQRIPRNLHKLLVESIYLPFCCRTSLLFSSHINISRSNLFEAHIMRLFFQTLTVLLAALGPHALQLPSVTRETLLLLIAAHNVPKLSQDPVVLPAMLQLLLTTLDLNVEAGSTAEERLVTEFGSMMAELVKWAGGLSNVVSIPEASSQESEGMGMPWPVIAAGIQVKWHEVGKKFQGRMLGLMGGEMDGF